MAGHRHRLHDDIHRTPDVSHISNPDVTHEESDVAVGPIAKFVFGLFVFGVIVCLLMALLFNFFERRAAESERPTSPLARQGAERLPPEPRLQLAPGWSVDLGDNRRVDLAVGNGRPDLNRPQSERELIFKEWQEELSTYGWADKAAGTVRMPIDDAMALYLQRQQSKGQPSGQSASPPPPAGGGIDAAAPSSREEMPAGSSAGQQTEKRNQ